MNKPIPAMPGQRNMISSRVVSIPNGKPAYPDGSLPCDHHIEFVYPDCTRTYSGDHQSGYRWAVKPNS